jgi:N-acetylglucosaminyldiphosphoundecaprenol N-acetyl-beta-D-mannosaminyltransferase
MSDEVPAAPLLIDPPLATVEVGAIMVNPMTESALVRLASHAWEQDVGGWIVTANVDIVRATARDPDLAQLVRRADIVVADGMPIVWAARISGHALPERVTGASLVYSLSEAAARTGHSIYLLGGEPGVPEAAAAALGERYTGLRVAGTDSPPFGFERSQAKLDQVVAEVAAAAPDLVFVGLGFPKQELVISKLRQVMPNAWYIGCGAGIPLAAGTFSRAPTAMQKAGAEWLHRLALEPRRLARRYLLDDAPFALRLLAHAIRVRLTGARAPRKSHPSAPSNVVHNDTARQET